MTLTLIFIKNFSEIDSSVEHPSVTQTVDWLLFNGGEDTAGFFYPVGRQRKLNSVQSLRRDATHTSCAALVAAGS